MLWIMGRLSWGVLPVEGEPRRVDEPEEQAEGMER